jgi:hypothetical protein
MGPASTPAAHLEDAELHASRGGREHAPGALEFQAAAVAHAAFTPAFVETHALPQPYAVGVGEPSPTPHVSGALAADARNLPVVPAQEAPGNLAHPDSDPLEAEAALLTDAEVSAAILGPPGVLADALAVDAARLQAGIRSFLDRLDHLGTSLVSTPSVVVLSCWVVAVAAAGTACEIVRRQSKRRPTLRWTGDPLFPWVPESVEEP